MPRRRSLPGDAGRPKFNQLEMHHYLYLRTQFGENRCTQYRGNRPTNTTSTTHPQTGPITIHCEQCNYTFQCWYCRSCKERLLTYRTASRCYSQAFCQQFSNNPWPPYNQGRQRRGGWGDASPHHFGQGDPMPLIPPCCCCDRI